MTDVEKVRLKIGDTNVEDALFADAEIAYFIEAESTIGGAAAAACESLAARFSRDIDFATDDQKFERQKRAKSFAELARDLRANPDAHTAGTVRTERVDGYSQGIDNEETDADTDGGRVRAGYVDPDFHP